MTSRRDPDLSMVPLAALVDELERRGIDVASAVAARLVDGRAVLDELHQYLTIDFPAAVAEVRKLATENHQLWRRTIRAEREAADLASVMAESAVRRLTEGDV